MGRPKAMLPFGPELMLQRVARLLAEVVEPIVIVAAGGQPLPELPHKLKVVRDRREDCGPLEGLAAGLEALGDSVEAAYATSCDVPLLVPAFVRRMIECCQGHDIAVPKTDGFHHPLAAVYRTSVLPHAQRLLAAERFRPVFLFDEVDARIVTEHELRDVDAELSTLKNLNRPADYLAALREAGFECPRDMFPQLGDGAE